MEKITLTQGLAIAMTALVKLQFKVSSKPEGYQEALDDVAKELRQLYEFSREHKSLIPKS